MNIINLINSFVFSNTFISSITVILLGLSLRVVLATCKQLWVTTFHQTMTFMILPLTTFMITKVISGNIALSLGMVGALSIVRFRNPVKNPFELVMYFGLITLGIAASVKLVWGFLLTAFITLIILFSHYFQNYLQKFGKKLFIFSFEEANLNFLADIQTVDVNKDLEKNSLMISFNYDYEKKVYNYRIGSNLKNEIVDIINKIDKKKIISINYSNL